jgi:hypothetical protein
MWNRLVKIWQGISIGFNGGVLESLIFNVFFVQVYTFIVKCSAFIL